MQAIQTKFLPATNHHGSRVKAYSEAFPRGVTVEWEHALSSDENHIAAARAFIAKYEWFGTWVSGGSADGKGQVFVCVRHGEALQVQAGRGVVTREGKHLASVTRHDAHPCDADEAAHALAAVWGVTSFLVFDRPVKTAQDIARENFPGRSNAAFRKELMAIFKDAVAETNPMPIAERVRALGRRVALTGVGAAKLEDVARAAEVSR